MTETAASNATVDQVERFVPAVFEPGDLVDDLIQFIEEVTRAAQEAAV